MRVAIANIETKRTLALLMRLRKSHISSESAVRVRSAKAVVVPDGGEKKSGFAYPDLMGV